MTVIIRADGNKQIAMGHIMRCLSIGEALRDKGEEVVFVTAGRDTEVLLRERGFTNHVLFGRYDRLEEELPRFLSYLKEKQPSLVLLDSYFLTKEYAEAVGNYTKTAWIDDMGEELLPVDMLINYNIYGQELSYEKRYQKTGGKLPEKLLLGCAYAPLRREFSGKTAVKTTDKKKAELDVLITTGGGDLYHAAEKLCLRLEKEIKDGLHKRVTFHVVCGPFSEQSAALHKLAEETGQFLLHKNVTNMSELMGRCDIAITAAGSTMYELCRMGVPSVCFYFAENQRRMAECFAARTGVINGGNLAVLEVEVLEKLLGRLKELEESISLRLLIREQMVKLVDGQGACRIAEEMIDYIGQNKKGPENEKAGSQF